MAYEIVKTKSIKATATFASKQYTFVKIDTNGQLATPSAGGYAVGVIQDKPAAADPGAVCYPGDITKVKCGGAFNAGDDVSTDGSGCAVAATSGAYVLGIALTAGVSTYLADIIYQPKASKM
jgi:hypothetical protein